MDINRLPKNFYALSIATVLMMFNASVQAVQPVPDAGQLSQELKKQPNLNSPASVDLLKALEEIQAQPAEANDVRMLVSGVKVSGNQLFDHALLEGLVTDLVGGRHNFSEIDAAVARITHYYRDHGYLVARAYLPVQDLNASMSFFEQLGFTVNPLFTFEDQKCMVWSDSIYIMLQSLSFSNI